jgi:hypothetical protein
MSNEKSDGDSLLMLIVLAGFAWFAYEKWWDIEPSQKTKTVISPGVSAIAVRPTGLIPITTLESGTSWWLEAETVKGQRTERLGWVLHDHQNDKKTPYRTSKELWLVDCEKDAFRILSFISYKVNGELGTRYETPADKAEVSYAVPSSNGAAVMRKLCQPVFDKTSV